MDVAPKTPRYAREYALIFTGRIGGSLLVHLNEAATADALGDYLRTRPDDDTPEARRTLRRELESEIEALKTDKYLQDFGHYLAMQGMGHGVSWFDNHARFEISIPDVEVYL